MDYLSAIIYTSMILDFNESVNGSSLSLPAHGRAGARATSFLVALFAKRKTKFGGGGNPSSRTLCVHYGAGARAGKNSFPQTPFLFARPSVKVFQNSASGFFRKKVRILTKRHSRYARTEILTSVFSCGSIDIDIM